MDGGLPLRENKWEPPTIRFRRVSGPPAPETAKALTVCAPKQAGVRISPELFETRALAAFSSKTNSV